ncbi:MAG: hypothetical protein ACOC80_05050 [Petrotogales bacterium]
MKSLKKMKKLGGGRLTLADGRKIKGGETFTAYESEIAEAFKKSVQILGDAKAKPESKPESKPEQPESESSKPEVEKAEVEKAEAEKAEPEVKKPAAKKTNTNQTFKRKSNAKK